MANKKPNPASLHPADHLHNAIVDALGRSSLTRDEKRDTVEQLVCLLIFYRKHWLGNA